MLLGGLALGLRTFHGTHVKVEERIVLVPLGLLLLPHLDDFLQHFGIEAVGLRFREYLLLPFVKLLYLSFDMLDAFDERANAGADLSIEF